MKMSREYRAVLLAAVICVLMSTEASGQPTLDDDGTCDRGLATSEQVANLIRKVDKVLASNSQQPVCPSGTVDTSRRALISALESEYRPSQWRREGGGSEVFGAVASGGHLQGAPL